MKNIIILALSFCFFITGCESVSYDLFLYPNRNELSKFQRGGNFDSVEEARSYAYQWMKDHQYGDYKISQKRTDSLGCIGIEGYEKTLK